MTPREWQLAVEERFEEYLTDEIAALDMRIEQNHGRLSMAIHSVLKPAKGFAGIKINNNYSPAGQTLDAAHQKAAERGLEVRYPKGNELFVDIDNARDFARFKDLVQMLGRIERVVKWIETPSASGGQHRHVVVTLGRDVTEFERIAFQAMLGSDLKREVLSYERLKTGSCPYPTMFFEPKEGVKPVAKRTGFHCTKCNFRNDFAEANQDDGTYVCFNCRVEE